MGDVKQFATDDYDGYAKGAKDLTEAVSKVDAQVKINSGNIGDMNFAQTDVRYGTGALTGRDLTEAVSQLSSNIGTEDVLNSMRRLQTTMVSAQAIRLTKILRRLMQPSVI